MEVEAIWNAICSSINKMNKDKNLKEKEFQQTVEKIFEMLGWSSIKGELIPQKTIQSGTKWVIADIILKNNEKNIIAIELKKNNNRNMERTEKQLFAYMRLLKLKFGIFIGENLQFYYEASDNGNPIRVFETDFIEYDKVATEFISLIDKIGKPFDESKILEFCKKRILNEEDKEKFEELKSEITDGDFDSKVEDLFIEFLKKEYNEQIANKISNEIEVKISLKNPSVRNERACGENNQKSRRTENFTFDMVGIKPGTTLVFTEDKRKECTVVKSEDGRTVRYRNEEYNLAPLVQELKGDDRPVRGIRFFKVKNKSDEGTLEEIFNRMLNKKSKATD